jgi:hypothetical protein
MTKQPPNARFWELVHTGWVKLTLKPGQRMEHVTGGYHDEGWSREVDQWEYIPDGEWADVPTFKYARQDGIPGPVIVRHEYHDGTDCDGRHSSMVTSFAALDALRAEPCVGEGPPVLEIDYRGRRHWVQSWVDLPGMFRPDWQRADASQRDYTAEAMGY